tara:strand:+ start:96 stop:302 length:207 start_codon:yes stop_codon:yes gene_type:complete
MKVGDLIQSSAFERQHGIILEVDLSNPDGIWYHVHWLRLNRFYAPPLEEDWRKTEWCRKHEIEPRDIS